MTNTMKCYRCDAPLPADAADVVCPPCYQDCAREADEGLKELAAEDCWTNRGGQHVVAAFETIALLASALAAIPRCRSLTEAISVATDAMDARR